MEKLKCTKCNEIKETSNFTPRKNSKKKFLSWCKKCFCDHAKSKHDGIYTVYYLPEENYCGYTKILNRRMNEHAAKGRNIDGMRILYASKNHTDAIHHEAMFQSYLGMNGLISGRK